MPNRDKKLSPKERAEIKRIEKLALKAYKCPGDRWTLGFGNTYRYDIKTGIKTYIKKGDTLKDRAEADALFDDVIWEYEEIVRKAINIKLTQDQFDVLVSFAYNTGTLGRSLPRAINTGSINAIPSKFIEWIGVPRGSNKPRNDEQITNASNNAKSLEPSEGLYNRRDLELRKFMGWNPKNVLLG